MSRSKTKKRTGILLAKYPPSDPCSCEICVNYCKRPGWWSVSEAITALDAGFGKRMMLEMAPSNQYGVLSPAFRGNEIDFAREIFSDQGCTFLADQRCELHGKGFQPLECQFCHHDRIRKGIECHQDIGRDWDSDEGRELIVRWSKETGFWDKRTPKE
jgi:hypothetical protein